MISSDIEAPEVDMANYLTIVALEDGLTAKLSLNKCYYSVDGGEWVLLEADTYTPEINIGQKLYFKGGITPSSSNGSGTFTITKNCNLEGNCMSLLYGDYAKNKNFNDDHTAAFYKLFAGNDGIIEISDGFLPSKNTIRNCYNNMFRECSNLIKAPRLNAMEMSYRCYYFMFDGCSSLFDVQEEMPATELAESCYEGMFNKCSSLTTTISLNAEIMERSCYSTMFQHCTSLVTAPELNSVKLANLCYKWMFYGCTNLKNAPAILPATELKNECYRLMFYNTAITTAPVLPAKTLVEHCYSHMFYKCSNLNYIKALFETTPSTSYTNYWVYNVASSGTFVKSNDATWNVRGSHGVPNNWVIMRE